MITLIDLEYAKLRQRELLSEGHGARLPEPVEPRGPSRTARVLRALAGWLSRPLEVAEEDQPWPLLERYPYGPRP